MVSHVMEPPGILVHLKDPSALATHFNNRQVRADSRVKYGRQNANVSPYIFESGLR